MKDGISPILNRVAPKGNSSAVRVLPLHEAGLFGGAAALLL
jgi:hypothetical protein